MKLEDLAGGAEGLSEAARDLEITGLTADSRRVRPGFVFAALKGVNVDGARFAPAAVAAGAAAVLMDEHGAAPGDVAVIRDANPRRRLAEMAARFSPRQPEVIAAVTGTNGKSSTVEFLRQIWAMAGHEAACLGTLGVTRAGGVTADLGHTTPDPVAVHETLDGLAQDGVTHLALEASSHGLAQYRLDAVRFMVVGFLNLTQDHLDYHASFDDYFAAKLRLFTELASDGASAIVNTDSDYGVTVADRCAARGLSVTRVGWRGPDVRLRELMPRSAGQRLELVINGREASVEAPLVGEFQALNVMAAAGMALATGVSQAVVLDAIAKLRGVRGRMELAGLGPGGAPVFVDYAHTPDGLEKLLKALRPHTQAKLSVVFGCGGDRDPTKRAPMGAVAARLADHVIVTDDNPRSEDPAAIRAAVLSAAPEAREIGDRAEAIAAGIAGLEAGDALVIAGKGHETGQIVGDRVIAFDDVLVARDALDAVSTRST